MEKLPREKLADVLGMSPRGGAFATRLGSMKTWGLASGRTYIRLTKDAQDIIKPLSTSEAGEAMERIVGNVPLFAELLRRGLPRPSDRLRLLSVLQDVTGASHREISSHLPLIERTLIQLQDYLPARRDSYKDSHIEIAPSAETTATSSGYDADRDRSAVNRKGTHDLPEDMRQKMLINFSGGEISLDETASNLDAVMLMLWNLRQCKARLEQRRGLDVPACPLRIVSDDSL